MAQFCVRLKFVLFVIFVSFILNVMGDDRQAEEETAKIFNELNINDNTIMTKEKFELFLRKLITRGHEQKDSNGNDIKNPFVERIIEKVTESVPETFGIQEMTKYLDQSVLNRVMEETTREFQEKNKQSGGASNAKNVEPEPESNTDL